MRKLLISFAILFLAFGQAFATETDELIIQAHKIMENSEIGPYVYYGFTETDKPRLRNIEIADDQLFVQLNTNIVYMDTFAYMGPLDTSARFVTKQIAAHFVKDFFDITDHIERVIFEVWAPVYIDKYGNVEECPVGRLSMDRITYNKINWEMASLNIIADLFEEQWNDHIAIRDPGELTRKMLRLSWSGDIQGAMQLWHPAVNTHLLRIFIESMHSGAVNQGSYLLTSIIDLIDFKVKPIGYDRYIVTPKLNDTIFDDATRLMLQKYDDGFVFLLPGSAFDSKGLISKSGADFLQANDRPDPNIAYKTAVLAMLQKDYDTFRQYTSELTPNEFVQESIDSIPEANEEMPLDPLKLYIMSLDHSVTIVDPFTVVLSKETDQRTAMRWENEMWKMLPPPAMEILFENYREGL